MMNTKTFTSVNRVIYDDNYSLKQQQKSSFINQFLKGLLSAITLLFFILLLIFAENTLFGLGFGDENKSMMISKSLNAFFDLHSPKYLQLNFLIVFRFFILSFTLFYALIKNFTNLYWHRATIKKYLPWFVLYLVIATISFLLFFTFFSVWPKEVFNLVFLLLVLFLLNLSYEIFNYFISKKTNPLLYDNYKNLIIAMVFQALLLLFVIITPLVWINTGKSPNFLFVDNRFYTRIVDIFTVQSGKNFIILIAFFFFLITFIVLANTNFFALVINKRYDRNYVKNNLWFILLLFSAIFIWLLRVFAYKHENENLPVGNNHLLWVYILQSFFAIIILILYMVFTLKKRLSVKSSLNTLLNLVVTQTILSLSLFLVTLFNSKSVVSLINVFITITVQMSVFGIYIFQNKNISTKLLVLLKVIMILIILTAAIVGFDYLLTSDHHNNYLFSNIQSKMNLVQIMLLLNFSLSFTLISYLTIKFAMVIFKINKLNKELNNEKK